MVLNIDDAKVLINDTIKEFKPLDKEEVKDGVTLHNGSNVVSGEKLRTVQRETLNSLKDYLSMTFGPMGSNTKIITGNSKETITSAYSKDGLKVLKNIYNAGPIEMSIIEELIQITRHVESEVGDGTTSTVILSSLIFERLMKIQKNYNIPPYQLIRKFENIVDILKKDILSNAKECTLDDIYNISMISTNSNAEVSETIRKIYEDYGMNVDLSVGISNSTESVIKSYDGLTITEGFADPSYISNRSTNTAEINKARVYHFADPIDTMEMIQYFEVILKHNIYDKYENDEEPIPTVITCPRISNDMSAVLKMLAQQLYKFDQSGAESQKPPILVVSNVVGSDEIIMDDIANLCGCKTIRKYIDPKIQKKDQEAGIAPTVDTVFDFYGEAELVVADNKKTKFINPKHMKIYKEDGSVDNDPVYTSMINFLETEIANEQDTNSKGLLKKRLSALKANMVEYLVGGVTISERDSVKDLVEDAIKNCKSAAKYGYGRAANFEGFEASFNLILENNFKDLIDKDIARCIFCSYHEIAHILYSTVSKNKDQVNDYIFNSLMNKYPYDISAGYLPNITDAGENVLCSIMLDVNILDTISKIITIMVTCNQCLVQATTLNNY